MERKLCGLETGFLKSPDMAGVGMPQVYGREMTTGELARSASMVIGTVLRETICCHIRGKIFAGKSHQTVHRSDGISTNQSSLEQET